MRNFLDIWRPERMNSWREMNALQRQMDRFFDEFSRYAPTTEFTSKDIDFIPACDLEETDKNYAISLDVPGMTRDQLKVELNGNTLTVSGEKKEEKKEGKGAGRTYERFHGRFERSFTLPQISESEKIEANYQDGVLHISVPKAVSAQGRKIEIGEGKGKLAGKSVPVEEKKEQKSAPKAEQKAEKAA